MEYSLGLYYLPRPGIPQVRMYVRRGESGAVEFRMWDSAHPEVWDKHEWLPLSVIEKAAGMYRSSPGHEDQDPLAIYDSVVAESLLREKGL